MEKHINVVMSDKIQVDVAGTPLDILFMVGIIIKDIHESTGIPYDELGDILNTAVKELASKGTPN